MDGALGQLQRKAVDEAPPPVFAVDDLRAYLRGSWLLRRRIDDRRAGEEGRLTGWLTFSDSPDGLSYREEGELVVPGYRGSAWRCYDYRLPQPHRAEVFFPGGAAFHDLDLKQGSWAVTHACGDDLYRGRFEALSSDALKIAWRVVGPRKDLVIDTQLKRQNGAEVPSTIA